MASKAGRPARAPRAAPTPATVEPVADRTENPVEPAIEQPVDHMIEQAAAAVAAAAPPAEETIMDATTAATDQAKTIFAEASDRTKTAYAKSQQMFGELGEFNKGNVEAMVESSKIAAKGIEQFGQSAAAYVRGSFEEAQAQARTLASAGSPTEFLKLQGDFARSAFDRLVAETSKTSEAMLKLVGEVAQPLSNRLALAADRFKVAA